LRGLRDATGGGGLSGIAGLEGGGSVRAYNDRPIIARLIEVLTIAGDPRIKAGCVETYLEELYRFPLSERPVLVIRPGKEPRA
jgi:hypothetical protein